MNLQLFITLCAIASLSPVESAVSEKCIQKLKADHKCDVTEYQSYVVCMRKRAKRSLECEENADCEAENCVDSCNKCNCDFCSYNHCEEGSDCHTSSCCNTCCNNYEQCRSHHCCHKTCHAECQSTSCRRSCRKSCYDIVNKAVEKETSVVVSGGGGTAGGSGSSFARSNTTNINAHNVTTIIHLNNMINNTQVIEVPINSNYTLQNDITVREQQEGVGYGGYDNRSIIWNVPVPPIQISGGGGVSGGTQISSGGTVQVNQGCCIVIGPRECRQTSTPPFFQCYHTRSHQCGPICSGSDIVHKELRQVCVPGPPPAGPFAPDCKNQVMYIPQPKPKCVYQSTWPYVSCGIQQARPDCSGCYSHYSDRSSQTHRRCSAQCYDDFSVGPYFRQGPIYQPSFSHMGPCLYGMGCPGGYGGYGGMGFGGGGFGYGGGMMGFQYPPMQMPPFGGIMPPMPIQGSPGFGGWTPNVEDSGNSQQTNEQLVTGFNDTANLFNPIISVGPLPIPAYPSYPYYPTKEVEIEVDVEDPNAPLTRDDLGNATSIVASG